MKNKIAKSLAIASLIALPMSGAHAAGAGNNHAAIFLGATNDAKGTEPTIGLEYEYRTPLWENKIGVGLVAERILKSKYDADLLLIGAVIHPWKSLKVNLFAGKEYLPSKTKDVVRVGVGYDLYYNNLSYGPVYNIDFIDGETAHVLGVAVGFGF